MKDPFIITDDGDAVRASRILSVAYYPEEGLRTNKVLARVVVETSSVDFDCNFPNNKAAQAERDRIVKILRELEEEEE